MATVFIRTIIIYLLFMLAIRLMGKRQVGELQLSELVTTFMLSELAVNPIQDISLPISYAVIPLVFLLSIEVIMSFITTKSNFFKKLFYGNPSIIIKNGVLNQKELERLRIGMNELLAELRLKDIADISDVDYAILEQNGKLSVFKKSEKETVSLGDLSLKKNNSGIAHAFVIDGKINESNLKLTEKNEEWVYSLLAEKKIKIENVFLLTCDDNNSINIIMKETN